MSEENNESFIGEPVFGNEKKNKRPNSDNANWKIDTIGSHIYRILPPFGLLATSGRWSFYEALHWGFVSSNGKKRVFRCIQRKGTNGMIQQECPMCSKITEMKNLKENKKKKLELEKVSAGEIEEILKPLTAWLSQFNLDKGHYLNVMRQDNQIGRLKIKIKQKQNLDVVINNLRTKDSINPISATGGVWLDFQRHGSTQHDTTYPVEVVQEEVNVNGRKLKAIKEAPLTPETIQRMKTEAFELSGFYKDLTYDQIKMLVNSDNDPEIVDSVFGAPVVQNSPEPKDAPEESPVSMDDDMEQKVMAEINRLQKNSSRKPASAAPSGNKASVSTEDFMRDFNTK